MSKLWDEHFGEARRALAFDALYRPHAAAFVVPDNDGLYRYAAELLGGNEPITYLEFGVADGRSIRKIAHEFTHPDSLFVGFDSFIGLPERWMMHARGTFTNRGLEPDFGDSRVKFVKGWFQNTFHESLGWLIPHLSRPVLVHYDADLYSSTLFLLTSLWPHCREYHFIMDDFMVDDIVALHDFSLAYPVEIEFLGRREGGIPHSVLGKMKRIEFALKTVEESPAEILERADRLVGSGQSENAQGLWRGLRETHPLVTPAWISAARHLRVLRRFGEADALLADAQIRFPDSPEATIEYAWIASDRRDWAEASRRWETARERFPNHPAPYYGAAFSLRELGRLVDAETILFDGRQRFPDDAGIALEYGWIAHSRRDWPTACRRWEEARAVAPGHPGGYIWGAQALCALGRAADAEALLKEACSLLPHEIGPAVELARFYQDSQDWATSEQQWRQVTTDFPGSPQGPAGLEAAQKRLPRQS